MLNRIIDTELEYLKCFCETESDGDLVHFEDDSLKDMYSHNFTYIPGHISDKAFVEAVKEALGKRRALGFSSLRLMTHKDLSQEVLSDLPIMPQAERYDYYAVSTRQFDQIKSRKGVSVKCVDDQVSQEHGKYIDVAANYMHMTMEFAIRRINRKFMVYLDKNSPLDLYICYDQNEPVGNCEAFIKAGLMKIEDFDILEMHQKKGFGSHVIRHMLEMGLEKQVEFAYVVTDHEDTAKHMYEKCGFKYVGHRTELNFKLE